VWSIYLGRPARNAFANSKPCIALQLPAVAVARGRMVVPAAAAMPAIARLGATLCERMPGGVRTALGRYRLPPAPVIVDVVSAAFQTYQLGEA
jgi:hypothetical protein